MWCPVSSVDAVVVGAGPNGLAAAVTLARAGLRVELFEAADTIGGGTRTAELTLSGFRHDVCSAVHPMALPSPFFRAFELERRVEFVVPEISYAHPLEGRPAGIAYRDLERTAERLGRDGAAWRRLFAPVSSHPDRIGTFTGSPLLRVPANPVTVARFGLRVLEQGSPAWSLRFRDDTAPAMLTGVAAHSIGRLPAIAPAAVAITLGGHAHAGGWPIPVGGSQTIADAMAADLIAHGGRITTGTRITDLRDLPAANATVLDLSAKGLLELGGTTFPRSYLRALDRFRFGDAVAKVDFALSEPVPWSDPDLREAPTFHIGGTRAQIARSEAEVAAGRHPSRPYILGSQPTIVDPSRAPAGRHVAWAYTHVPRGSTLDPTEIVTAEIERHAPGFRDTILASSARSAGELAAYNPNYVGGDISAGAVTLAQLLRRPILSPVPWRTPMPGLYLGSSSTPPATGVHGMSGYQAALYALRDRFELDAPALGLHA